MKIAIAGYGIEGESSYRYFSQLGHDVTIFDQSDQPKQSLPAGAKTYLGPQAFDEFAVGYDIVVRTPPLSPRRIRTSAKVWSATNEFFANCPAPIIGVTGTKGKGTTTSWIASILKQAGKTVHTVGNIGTPALDVLPNVKADDIVVFELSSFQLWDIEKSPTVAVVLMVEADHLDVHADMADYIDAKSGITRHQTVDDVVFYHPQNQFSKQIAYFSSGKKMHYADSGAGEVYVRDNMFYRDQEPICGIDAINLIGGFNLENACAAISAALIFTDSHLAIEDGLRDFKGLPHRLRLVREFEGVAYYDDSIATTPGSAIAAMQSFHGRKVLILGGSDKGADYRGVIEVARQTGTTIVAIGQTGESIYQLCQELNVMAVRETGLMPQIVASAHGLAKAGGVVLLSPASASFDQFKSYSDRGDKFIAAVEGLGA